ncbi:MAG TPA: FAD-dependent oxidoreductase [Micromonosporaceae bacterium]|nr:FAD-dependent oxidoreductase [Micromonosporaceae bacterium]
MTRKGRVAILGGGMAGMAAAWRLSAPGWRDRFESITVYQRGWRLGGKGASGRGRHGRIEEHGLHVWLGSYENAFRLMRECYAELDRDTTDPGAPIRTWRDGFVPASILGLEELHARRWQHWSGEFTRNNDLPGEPDAHGGTLTVANVVTRALCTLADFARSLPVAAGPGRVSLSTDPRPPAEARSGVMAGLGLTALAALLEATTMTHRLIGSYPSVLGELDQMVDAVRATLATAAEHDDGLRRAWELVSAVAAIVRGIIADGLLTDPRGFRAINDEDYRHWLHRHGAPPEAVASTLVSGLYNMAFAQVDGDPGRESFGAGWGIALAAKMFLDYRGAIFWKMTAGMGDVVFAPLYQALRRRGVDFAFFHRVDKLHLSADRSAIDAVSVGVQARLADGVNRYEPLVRVRGLPCFPAAPLADQLVDAGTGDPRHAFESYWSDHPDAEQRVLRRGTDFDTVVLAIPVGMAGIICRELVDDRREWKEMVANVRTVATQALQLWLREDEPTLGWNQPGTTVTGYVRPFETWASMPQVIDAEDWPAGDRPGTIAYFCGSLAAPWPADRDDTSYPRRYHDLVRTNAERFVATDLARLLPGAQRDGELRWDLLCGADARRPAGLEGQFWVANVDPSDRYVQSVAGSDRFRLRPDESGYDNLYLAGDWTDCGMNAGCIEAAVLSGLQAANAVLGRSRRYGIAGNYLW